MNTPRIRLLHLLTPTQRSTESIKRVAEAVAHTHSDLKIFSLLDCAVSDEGLKGMCPYLAAAKVPVVRMEHCGLTDNSADYICSVVKAQEGQLDSVFWNSTLRSYGNGPEGAAGRAPGAAARATGAAGAVTSESRHAFISAASGSAATAADTAASANADAGADVGGLDPEDAAFTRALMFRGLRALSLRGNGLGARTIKQVSRCLSKNQWVFALDLSENNIDTGSLDILAKALRSNSGLQVLCCGGNPGASVALCAALDDQLEAAVGLPGAPLQDDSLVAGAGGEANEALLGQMGSRIGTALGASDTHQAEAEAAAQERGQAAVALAKKYGAVSPTKPEFTAVLRTWSSLARLMDVRGREVAELRRAESEKAHRANIDAAVRNSVEEAFLEVRDPNARARPRIKKPLFSTSIESHKSATARRPASDASEVASAALRASTGRVGSRSVRASATASSSAKAEEDGARADTHGNGRPERARSAPPMRGTGGGAPVAAMAAERMLGSRPMSASGQRRGSSGSGNAYPGSNKFGDVLQHSPPDENGGGGAVINEPWPSADGDAQLPPPGFEGMDGRPPSRISLRPGHGASLSPTQLHTSSPGLDRPESASAPGVRMGLYGTDEGEGADDTDDPERARSSPGSRSRGSRGSRRNGNTDGRRSAPNMSRVKSKSSLGLRSMEAACSGPVRRPWGYCGTDRGARVGEGEVDGDDDAYGAGFSRRRDGRQVWEAGSFVESERSAHSSPVSSPQYTTGTWDIGGRVPGRHQVPSHLVPPGTLRASTTSALPSWRSKGESASTRKQHERQRRASITSAHSSSANLRRARQSMLAGSGEPPMGRYQRNFAAWCEDSHGEAATELKARASIDALGKLEKLFLAGADAGRASTTGAASRRGSGGSRSRSKALAEVGVQLKLLGKVKTSRGKASARPDRYATEVQNVLMDRSSNVGARFSNLLAHTQYRDDFRQEDFERYASPQREASSDGWLEQEQEQEQDGWLNVSASGRRNRRKVFAQSARHYVDTGDDVPASGDLDDDGEEEEEQQQRGDDHEDGRAGDIDGTPTGGAPTNESNVSEEDIEQLIRDSLRDKLRAMMSASPSLSPSR